MTSSLFSGPPKPTTRIASQDASTAGNQSLLSLYASICKCDLSPLPAGGRHRNPWLSPSVIVAPCKTVCIAPIPQPRQSGQLAEDITPASEVLEKHDIGRARAATFITF